MSSSAFFDISAFIYILAMVTYVSYLVTRTRNVGIIATSLTILGFVSQSIALLIRWANSYDFWIQSNPTSSLLESLLRAAPLRNLYESLVFFVWSLILIHLIIEFKYKNRSLGAFVTPIAALALAFIDVSGTTKEIQPLVPALQSNWLLFHVLLSFLGYAAFGVSFGAAVAYIVMITESRKESAYVFWSIIVGVFLVVLVGMGIDFLSLSASQRETLIQSHFLKATFRSSSGGIVAVSWIVSLAFILVIWQFGTGLKNNRVSSLYDRWTHNGCHMGEQCLGKILDLGPKRDVVSHNMVCLCPLLACTLCRGMEREKGCNTCGGRFCSRDFYLSRG
jgi:ABC-type transport system involved in cytochrome c biogenesis permease subunit